MQIRHRGRTVWEDGHEEGEKEEVKAEMSHWGGRRMDISESK